MAMKNLIFTFFSLFLAASLHAQYLERALVSASGFHGQTAGYSFEYSLGEPSIGSFVFDNLNILVGFHHPLEQLDTSIPFIGDRVFVNVYPNPTRSFIYVQFFETEHNMVRQLNLTNMLGKTVLSYSGKDLTSNPFKISMTDLHPGIYFLRVDFANLTSQVISISYVI